MCVSKITVVGAGNVGASVANLLADKELANRIILVDILEGIPQGKGLDMSEASPVERYDTRVIGSNGYDEIEGSGIVIMTAGIARKPGMSRDDLQSTNANIVKDVMLKVKEKAPDAIIIMVTNPLDVMTYLALKVTGFKPNKVFGMAGILDTARFRYFISEALDVSVKDIQAMVLGGHGDTMVPLLSYTTIAGIPITDLLPKDKLDSIVQRTRDGGAEIVKYLKTGSAYYAPAAAVVEMVSSIIKDSKRILPCAAYLNGEYGFNDTYLGVPVKLGKNGIEQILEVKLTAEEKSMLQKSADAVKEGISKLSL
jgi:malate dehydrogenase